MEAQNPETPAKDWFNEIFNDENYGQIQEKVESLDEGTKTQVKAIFDADVFQSNSIARSWVSDKDEANLLDAKQRMTVLMKDSENPLPQDSHSSESSFSDNNNSIHEDAK